MASKTTENSKEKLAVPLIILLLIVLFFVIFNPIAIVGVGERGVKVTLGKVSPQSYTEGVHFVMPEGTGIEASAFPFHHYSDYS